MKKKGGVGGGGKRKEEQVHKYNDNLHNMPRLVFNSDTQD